MRLTKSATQIKKNNVRDLRLVMAGQGISLVGDAITALALPIVAVDLLNANSLDTGLLGAASTVAYLALGLQAGVWIDRASRRQFLIAADVVRVVLLLAIPAPLCARRAHTAAPHCNAGWHWRRNRVLSDCNARVSAETREWRAAPEDQLAHCGAW